MRRFPNRFRFLLSCAFLSWAPWAQAQASLSGSVSTPDGLGVPQLSLTLEGGSAPQRAVTGPLGRYRFTSLTPGEYRVSVDAPGFALSGDGKATVQGDARLDLVLQPQPVREQVVVTATRGDAALSGVGVTVTALDTARLNERDAPSFVDLLREVPGVSVARAGGVGLQTSAFVRGGESNFALVLIDGVPVNEPGGAYNYAAQFPLELGQVEVVRGAASSLYGNDALAGAVHLVTRRAAIGEKAGVSLDVEGGDFAWRRARGATSGRASRFDWNGGVARLETDNEQPNSRFEQTAGAASFGAQLSADTTFRLVVRGETSSTGTPGATAFGRPDLDAISERGELVTSGVLRHARGATSHELRVGYAKTDQLSLNPLDSGNYTPSYGSLKAPFDNSDFTNPLGYQNDTGRLNGGYQLEARLGGRHLLTAGAEVERETGSIGDKRGPLLSPERTNFGAYAQDRIALGTRLFLTAGARVERNDSYGTHVVPRAAIAYRLGSTGQTTTLRASAGAGIKEPSFLQSFGVSTFALGNPDLIPEKSRTFDVGVEQRAFGDRLRLDATAFHHDYRDQIAYKTISFSPFVGSYENLGRTRGQGLEISAEAAPTPRARFGGNYTYLDGEVRVSTSTNPLYAVGERLLRRPKHQASLWAQAEVSRVSLGANLSYVGSRADSDFFGIGLTENAAYTRVDARLRIRVTRALEAYVAAENLFDSEYQEILGYPALGRAVRAGIRFRSSGLLHP